MQEEQLHLCGQAGRDASAEAPRIVPAGPAAYQAQREEDEGDPAEPADPRVEG